MSSIPFLLKILKVSFLIGALVQVTQCVRPSSSKSTAAPNLVRGQDDPNQMYSNPNKVSTHLRDHVLQHHMFEKHQYFEKDLKYLGASKSELKHGKKMLEFHHGKMKEAEKNSEKVLKVGKQLASDQHPNFEDRNLQRLRPNPASKIQKKKSTS